MAAELEACPMLTPAKAVVPLTARPPDAVRSPATDSVLLAAAAASMTRVLVLLDPSTVLPCTVSPPESVRLAAVRLLCSCTGAVKLVTALTVSEFELLVPMVVLSWMLTELECSVGELMVSPTTVPAMPMTVGPAPWQHSIEDKGFIARGWYAAWQADQLEGWLGSKAA